MGNQVHHIMKMLLTIAFCSIIALELNKTC